MKIIFFGKDRKWDYLSAIGFKHFETRVI